MKNLSKILVVFFFVAIATESFSQTLGLKAGLNMSNMLFKDEDGSYSDDFKFKPGFHVGLTADIEISELFSIEPGLLISSKGYREKYTETFLGEKLVSKGSLNLYYVEIPILAKFSFDIGENLLYVGTGPYLGVGIVGNSRVKVTYQGETEKDSESIEWGSDENEDDFNRLDFGVALAAGVELNHSIILGLFYHHGLANISTYNDFGFRANNRVLGVSVGYRFGEKAE